MHRIRCTKEAVQPFLFLVSLAKIPLPYLGLSSLIRPFYSAPGLSFFNRLFFRSVHQTFIRPCMPLSLPVVGGCIVKVRYQSLIPGRAFSLVYWLDCQGVYPASLGAYRACPRGVRLFHARKREKCACVGWIFDFQGSYPLSLAGTLAGPRASGTLTVCPVFPVP